MIAYEGDPTTIWKTEGYTPFPTPPPPKSIGGLVAVYYTI